MTSAIVSFLNSPGCAQGVWLLVKARNIKKSTLTLAAYSTSSIVEVLKLKLSLLTSVYLQRQIEKE